MGVTDIHVCNVIGLFKIMGHRRAHTHTLRASVLIDVGK